MIKLSSLGDLFHALPAVHGLKTGLDAVVDWVVDSRLAPVVECFPDVERVIAFPRHGIRRRARPFLDALRAERYDLVLDFQGLLKSALVARLARGRRRIGPSFHREGSRLFYPEVAGPRNKERHAVEENLDILRFLGLPIGEPRFPLAFPAAAPETATASDSFCIAISCLMPRVANVNSLSSSSREYVASSPVP